MRVFLRHWFPQDEGAPPQGDCEMTPEEILALADRFDVMIKRRFEEEPPRPPRRSRLKGWQPPARKLEDLLIVALDRKGGGFRQR